MHPDGKEEPESEYTDQYWDCECEDNFIHPSSKRVCFNCNTAAVTQPPSRVSEVISQGLKIDKNKERIDRVHLMITLDRLIQNINAGAPPNVIDDLTALLSLEYNKTYNSGMFDENHICNLNGRLILTLQRSMKAIA